MAKNLFYISPSTGEWAETENSIEIVFFDMIQNLLIWYGEQPFNAENGIDYEAVFNLQKLITPEIGDITNQYLKYFSSITTTIIDNTTENLQIQIDVVLLTGDQLSETISI